jgi:predicted amidohydrolase
MSRQIKLAVLQMDATPAPTDDRLNRATKLVESVAQTGANLIVLPELFNTGYTYDDSNYAVAETMNDATVTWMSDTARQHEVYLVGSLLLRDHDHVYNSALLFAPDGKMWRYDKQYPFLWERAFFREGKGIMIADTELGQLGLMICWDSAHPELWSRYAGMVDAMVIISCPPMISQSTYVFPDGKRLPMATQSKHFADGGIQAQAKWMQVPVVHSSGHGNFSTPIPVPEPTVAFSAIQQPGEFMEMLKQAPDVMLEAKFGYHTQVIDADGKVLARVTQDGDAFTVATIDLADEKYQPDSEQPVFDVTPQDYVAIDVLSDMLYAPVYQRQLKRQWGKHMAPIDWATKVWASVTVIALFLGMIIGSISRKKDR